MANDYYSATDESRHTLARSDSINADRQAVEAAFDKLPSPTALQQASATFATDTGAADAYAIALTPTLTAYNAGLSVSFIVGSTNTGASTLNIDGLGARAIKMADGSDPDAGDLKAGALVEMRYDGTNFVVTSPDLGAVAAAEASATAAATSEANAATSEANAATSEANAAASFDSFDDRYLGAKSSDPGTDNDGNALLTGALYFNTTVPEMRVWNGSSWDTVSGDYDSTNVNITGGSITGITDLAVADGGTGASTASGARSNLGLGSIATQSAASVSITGGSISGITDLAVADGGTGGSTAGDARTNLGLGSMATQSAASVSITGGALSGIADLAIADGGTGASTAAGARSNLGVGPILESEVDLTNGGANDQTTVELATGLPGGLNVIDVMINGASTTGTGDLLIQIGDSGGYETSGYTSTGEVNGSINAASDSSAGFLIQLGSAERQFIGTMRLRRISGNKWVAEYAGRVVAGATGQGGGVKELTGTLDRIRIDSQLSENFDNGTAAVHHQ